MSPCSNTLLPPVQAAYYIDNESVYSFYQKHLFLYLVYSMPLLDHIKDQRAAQAWRWFIQLPEYSSEWDCTLLFADASYRRYFRLSHPSQKSLVLIDSPPDKEPISAFITIGKHWRQQGMFVPEIYRVDGEQGFALLEDLGDVHLEKIQDSQLLHSYHQQVVELIATIQSLPQEQLPEFDATHIQAELSICIDWTLPWLGLLLDNQQQQHLDRLFQWLTQKITSQPYRVMHRDFHCRNMMVVDSQLAIIDFQGAMIGPYCYDLMSFLTDAYANYSDDQVESIQQHYLSMSTVASQEDFLFDVSCVQLQRHIKIVGIFCRLWLRDNRAQYLQYIPRVCSFIEQASQSLLAREPNMNAALAIIAQICHRAQAKAHSLI